MAEGFGRGIAIAAILAALAAVGMYAYLLSECVLFAGGGCETIGFRTLYLAGGATFLGLAAILAVLTGEATLSRVVLILTTLAALVGAGLFGAMVIDAPIAAYRWAGVALAVAAGVTLLSASFAWRRAA